jgi:hypothetical protein
VGGSADTDQDPRGLEPPVSVNPRMSSSFTLKRTLAALAASGLLMSFTPVVKDAAAAGPKSSSGTSTTTTTTFNGDGRKN